MTIPKLHKWLKLFFVWHSIEYDKKNHLLYIQIQFKTYKSCYTLAHKMLKDDIYMSQWKQDRLEQLIHDN